jgi:hypothetical protein
VDMRTARAVERDNGSAQRASSITGVFQTEANSLNWRRQETRLRTHPNHLAVNLLGLPDNRHLRRYLPNDLPDR